MRPSSCLSTTKFWPLPPEIALNFKSFVEQQQDAERKKSKELGRHMPEELLEHLYSCNTIADMDKERFGLLSLYGTSGQTVLHCIADEGEIKDSSKLLELAEAAKGARVSIDAKDTFNNTALYISTSRYPSTKTLTLTTWLLKNKADPNAKCQDGKTALHVAATYGAPELISLLLSFGANPELTDDKGWNPRFTLCETKYLNQNDLLAYDRAVDKAAAQQRGNGINA